AGEAELLTIATHPDHRRQGIARALMQDWMRSASALAETAFLELAADNAGAAALYAQFGFECVAQRPNYYVRPDHRIDALILRAPLPFSD
ncbi:MAG: GNAT family N-acetyltransferase, partial [Pseudomonadota bacterium]